MWTNGSRKYTIPNVLSMYVYVCVCISVSVYVNIFVRKNSVHDHDKTSLSSRFNVYIEISVRFLRYTRET